jgi:hypothetical protein
LRELQTQIFNDTACGAKVTLVNNGVTISCHIKELNKSFSKTFNFPFDSKDIIDWCQEMDFQCDMAWDEVDEKELA